MITAIISTALGIVLFLCLYLGFRTGLRLGMTTAKGIIPPPVKNPVEAVQGIKQDIAQAKSNKAFTEGINAIMNYTGDLPEDK